MFTPLQDSVQGNANTENKDGEGSHQQVVKPEKSSNVPPAVNFVEDDAPCSREDVKALDASLNGDTSTSQPSLANTGNVVPKTILVTSQNHGQPQLEKNYEPPQPNAEQKAKISQKRGHHLEYPKIQQMNRHQTPTAAIEELHEDSKLSTNVRCLSCLRSRKLSCALHITAVVNEVLLGGTQHFVFRLSALVLAIILTLVAQLSRDKQNCKRLELGLAYYWLTFCLFAICCVAFDLHVPELLELSAQTMLALGFAITAFHCGSKPGEEGLPRWRDSRATTDEHRHVD